MTMTTMPFERCGVREAPSRLRLMERCQVETFLASMVLRASQGQVLSFSRFFSLI
jgi:hypothetical protein